MAGSVARCGGRVLAVQSALSARSHGTGTHVLEESGGAHHALKANVGESLVVPQVPSEMAGRGRPHAEPTTDDAGNGSASSSMTSSGTPRRSGHHLSLGVAMWPHRRVIGRPLRSFRGLLQQGAIRVQTL